MVCLFLMLCWCSFKSILRLLAFSLLTVSASAFSLFASLMFAYFARIILSDGICFRTEPRRCWIIHFDNFSLEHVHLFFDLLKFSI